MPLTNFTHLVHLAWNLTHLGLRLQLCDCSPFKEPRMIVNLAWTSTHLGLRLQLQLCDCARNARLSKKCLAWNSTHIGLLLQLQLCDCVGFSCKSKKCLAWNPPWSPFAMQLCNCSPSKEPRMIVNIARTSTHLGLLLQLQLCDCIRTQRPLVKDVLVHASWDKRCCACKDCCWWWSSSPLLPSLGQSRPTAGKA